VASGDGLGHVLVRRPTSFDVTTRDVGGDANLQVDIFGEFFFTLATALLKDH